MVDLQPENLSIIQKVCWKIQARPNKVIYSEVRSMRRNFWVTISLNGIFPILESVEEKKKKPKL